MTEIEKGIPVPKSAYKRKDVKGLCAAMDVGDSFLHPYQRSVSDINKALAPKKFHCGKYLGQYRIWRVE